MNEKNPVKFSLHLCEICPLNL